MSGETDLRKLIAGMAPRLLPGEFVFVTFPGAVYGDHADLEPVASCLENEGLSLVVPRERALARGLPAEVPLRAITLGVHSSLEAVGLVAAVSASLAENAISANMVAGYFHDHVYVPSADAERALAVLEALAG